MRAVFILCAIAVSSVVASRLPRQEEEHDGSSTTHAGTETTTASTGNGTPVATDPCVNVCNIASSIYSSCHEQSNSLACFCTQTSIDGLSECAACRDQQATAETRAEAEAIKESVGGIIQACRASSISVAPPSKITITATATVTNPGQITAPPAAKLPSSVSKVASASGNKSASGSKSASAGTTSPSGATRSSGNGASGLDVSLAGLVGAGALALFI
ncbi:hypothetical protein AAF712_008835 [Marasmius tenuissimus]|uniref:Extracellular membrane protein CFEM domain-containing protein n=1 Tax=Marasmius tenuissimus TaxID=585030 RepID=A0ABR2ZSJ2_9AGAR|nr:hypothetical protein PM082_018042 [Marasmius tenuissimus]KAJ8081243.1 hypothetical protein PM082_018088 [Marasmius tenuissimus]